MNSFGINRRRRGLASRRFRRLDHESLDRRLTMTGDLEGLDNAAALTLSFAPDGTPVGNAPNSLGAALQHLGPAAEWQAAITRAFQTWAQYANVNLGVVADDGGPFGARGLTHGDPRFGDIRVAGVPMSADTWAAAIDEHRVFAGTWTGDAFFNSDATWSSLDDLFAVALHEAGHVLGLPHSTDPTSPMFTHGLSSNLSPTAADIALLQELYGARGPDEHEQHASNDTRDKATSIEHAEAHDGFDGSTPLVEFGDLHATTDADYYMLPLLTGYGGSLSFDVRTQGLSLMRPRVTVFDRHGNQLATATSAELLGGTAHVQVTGPFSEKLYIRVDSTSGDLFAVGGYALVARYDGLNTTPPATVSTALREGFRWRGLTDDSLATINLGPLLRGDDDPVYDDDAGSDDDDQTGRSLDPVTASGSRLKYQYVGTVSSSGDVDHYRTTSPTFAADDFRNLTVAVEALKLDGVIADVSVLDDQGHELPAEVVANGSGLVMLHVPHVLSHKEYVVQVRTNSLATSGDVGNYSFTASYDQSTPGFEEFARGAVSPDSPEAVFTLYVARSQLFTFVLDSTPSSASPGAMVWATILDDHNRPVFLAAAPTGESRSSTSSILAPGEYHMVVSSRQADGLTSAPVDFVIRGRQASDPIGPPIVDPGSPPIYTCPGAPSPYCYPGGITSSVPFVTVPGGPPSPGTGGATIAPPADEWFWSSNYVRTNPVNPIDVIPDSIIAPIDVLEVINFINANPSGVLPIPPVSLPFLDVNADGWVSPIDALLIINQLNMLAGGEGEPAPTGPLSAAVAAPTNVAQASDIAIAPKSTVIRAEEDATVAEPQPSKTLARRRGLVRLTRRATIEASRAF